jgi:ABC-type nickel/cobalt efflux system permease component RcnA
VARLIAALGLFVVLSAQPAHAHPFGLPGIVRATLAGDTITTEWVLADDDEAVLADHLAKTGQSRADYFRSHFTIEDCPVEGDYTFVCERPPARLTIRSTLLVDIDANYRTLFTMPVGDRTERHFLSGDAPNAVVGITDDVGRAEQIAEKPRRALPSLERRFVELLDRPRSTGALLAGLAGALVVGAVHALSPGHGKSVAAAYLVGAKGRPVHALLLGGIVAGMHTGSVLALGLATWYFTDSVAPGDAIAFLRDATALMVLAIGVYLVITRTRHRRQHSHGHEHTHSHDATPFSRAGIVALGLSGGLLPSPAALVVLLAGLSADRLPLAMALVAAFSLGLAAAVTGVGLAALKGRELIELRSASAIPLVAAYAILLAGVVLTVRAVA